MVCYARPASRLAVILVVAWLVFARPVSHFFDTAALAVAATAATAGAAVAAALVFAAFMSARRRRAAAGGCVSCQFRCQHAMTQPAMTGRPRRAWLVTTTDDRRPQASRPAPGQLGGPGHPCVTPARSEPILLPVPTVRSSDTVPRWPDRPAYRAAPERERVGAPA